MIILIISICRGMNDRNLVLRRIGNYGKQTLSVYVLHWFAFGVFTKKMFFPLANADKSVATYFFFGGVILAILISYIIIEVCIYVGNKIKKIPKVGKYII